jgi:hypothetical protein
VFKSAAKKEPGTAVAVIPEAKQWIAERIAEAEAKVNKRIPKQAVLDYLAQHGVQVKTAILGAPKSEQEGARRPGPTSVPATLDVDINKMPPGYGVDVSVPGRITVLAPNGDRFTTSAGSADGRGSGRASDHRRAGARDDSTQLARAAG